jgi:hypothetical protein
MRRLETNEPIGTEATLAVMIGTIWGSRRRVVNTVYPYRNLLVRKRTHLIESPVQAASEMGCVGSERCCEPFVFQ